jgi:superfamily II DNA or RNA helicase
MTTAPALRPYQLEALEAVEQAHRAGKRRVLVSLPTGTGKTVVFAEAIRRRGGRALVVAHRDELLGQAEAKLEAAGIAPASIGRVQAGRDDTTSPVVLASAQTLARAQRRERLERACEAAGPFSSIIVDEAHHAVAPSYRAILEDFATDGTLVLGVTATPARAGLERLLGPPVYSRDLVDMTGEGWLCDLRGRRVELAVSLGKVRRTSGDYLVSDLSKALGKARMPAVVARAVAEEGEGRPALVFVPSVELAHATAKALVRRKVAAEALDGTTPALERAAILSRFTGGDTAVLVNVGVLTEGVDLPHVSCIVVARPTLSPILYAQMVGRGTRLAPGKADCLVLDLVGASERHQLLDLGYAKGARPQRLSDLVGLPRLAEGASVLDTAVAEARREREAAKAEARRERARRLALVRHERLLASDVSLLGRKAIRWTVVPGPTRTFALGLRTGHVVVTGEPGGGWTTYVLDGREATTLGSGLTLDQATALAEQRMREERATHLVAADAPWRQYPATERQLELLRRVRELTDEQLAGLTRGEASDLLDVVIAADRLARARREGRVA